MYYLTVIEPFDGYQKGDQIRDQVTIDTILASDQAAKVIKTFEQAGS